MPHEAPPIVRLAERVLVEIEEAVRSFPRYHKYAVGTELREQARNVARVAHRAWRDQQRKREWIGKLVYAVDDLKLSLQISKRVRAFKSFAQFEALARLISDLGRQCGGWQRQHSKGQNSQVDAPAGRAQILRPLIKSDSHGYTQSIVLQADARNDSRRRLARSHRSDISVLAANEVALHESECAGLRRLWRAWDSSLRALVEQLRELPRRYGQTTSRHATGPEGKQRQLRTIQLPLGHQETERSQSPQQSHGDGRWCNPLRNGVGRSDGARPRHGQRSHQTWLEPGTRSEDTSTAQVGFPLKPLDSGIDFLGYIVKATHCVVRRRVIHHAREKLRAWQRRHVHTRHLRATPDQYRAVQSLWTSYAGHFSHAASMRLHERFHREFPWLRCALIKRRFHLRWEGRQRSVRRGAKPA